MKNPGFIATRKAVKNDNPVTGTIHAVLTFHGQPHPDK
jgi:hypothetical protein